jgi:hypothetical protein
MPQPIPPTPPGPPPDPKLKLIVGVWSGVAMNPSGNSVNAGGQDLPSSGGSLSAYMHISVEFDGIGGGNCCDFGHPGETHPLTYVQTSGSPDSLGTTAFDVEAHFHPMDDGIPAPTQTNWLASLRSDGALIMTNQGWYVELR